MTYRIPPTAIRVREATTSFEAHKGTIFAILQLRNGSVATAASSIRIWPASYIEARGKVESSALVELIHTPLMSPKLVELRDATLVSSSHDGSIVMWKEEEGSEWKVKMVISPEPELGINAAITQMKVLNDKDDNEFIGVLAADNLKIFDSAGNKFNDQVYQTNAVTFTQLSPGVVIIASFNGSVVVYGWKKRTILGIYSGVLSAPTNCLITLSDGRLASSSYQKIQLWNVETMATEVLHAGSTTSWTTAIVQLSDSSLASSDLYGLMMLIDLHGTVTHVFDTKFRPQCLVSSRDGSILCGTSEGVVIVWKMKTRYDSLVNRCCDYVASTVPDLRYLDRLLPEELIELCAYFRLERWM